MAARRKQPGLGIADGPTDRDFSIDVENERDTLPRQHLPFWVRKAADLVRQHSAIFLVGAFLAVVTFGAFSLRQGVGRVSYPVGYPVAEPESCGNDHERVINVLRWAKANGGSIHRNISTGLFPIPENPDVKIRGVLATGDVRQKEKIFIIPANLLLNIQKLTTHHWLGPIYKQTPQLHDSIGGLAVLLLVEAMNATSFYRPYLCSLPQIVPLPIFYRPGKLEAMKGQLAEEEREAIDDLVEARRDVAQLHFMRVMPTLYLKYPQHFAPELFTYERFVWAVSIIMSRSWGRQIVDPIINAKQGTNTSKAHTLAPGADMPNHNATGFEAMQDKEGRLILVADRNVSKGDQVFISYGAKCNAEFLAHYGFIPSYPSVKPCRHNRTHTRGAEEAGRSRNMSDWRKAWRNKFHNFLTIVTDKRFRNSKAYLHLQAAAANPGIPSHIQDVADDAKLVDDAE